MTSDDATNLHPETEAARPAKTLIGGHATDDEVALVDEAVLTIRRDRPRFKRAHAVVEAAVDWATGVVGKERATEILGPRYRRRDDRAA